MENYKLYDLEWDSNFFGIKCGKLILEKELQDVDWNTIKNSIHQYKLIYIENRNGLSLNEKKITQETNAFLTDINIQFIKKKLFHKTKSEEIQIFENLPYTEEIIQLAEFPFSRFIEDEKLRILGGTQVYKQWLINSFSKSGKFFSIYKSHGSILGFILFSFKENACVIELIAVSETERGSGIGKLLFDSVLGFAHEYGKDNLQVGTQLKNKPAINFYHSMGCKQTTFSTIYHLWNESVR